MVPSSKAKEPPGSCWRESQETAASAWVRSPRARRVWAAQPVAYALPGTLYEAAYQAPVLNWAFLREERALVTTVVWPAGALEGEGDERGRRRLALAHLAVQDQEAGEPAVVALQLGQTCHRLGQAG